MQQLRLRQPGAEGMLFQHFPWLVHSRKEISQKLLLSGMRGEATLRAIISRWLSLIMCHCSSSDIMLRVLWILSCWGS